MEGLLSGIWAEDARSLHLEPLRLKGVQNGHYTNAVLVLHLSFVFGVK